MCVCACALLTIVALTVAADQLPHVLASRATVTLNAPSPAQARPISSNPQGVGALYSRVEGARHPVEYLGVHNFEVADLISQCVVVHFTSKRSLNAT